MGLRNMGKTYVKKTLNVFGFDLVRVAPSNPQVPERRFKPTEADKFLWLSSLGIKTVIDIGADTGDFATRIHAILPDAFILSFEPLKESFQQLEHNMKHLQNFRAFNCALGNENTQMVINKNEFSPSSSLLRMTQLHKEAYPFTAQEYLETVDVKRLDDVLNDDEVKEKLLIKLDVQGYEDKVIMGAAKLVSKATLLIIETSFRTLYEGQPLFDTIYHMMTERGFAYAGNLEQFQSPIDGTILQADAIFLRNAPSPQFGELYRSTIPDKTAAGKII